MESKKTFIIVNQTAGSPYHGMVYRNYYIAREWVKQGHKAIIISGSYFHNFSSLPKTDGLFTKEEIDGIEYWWVKLPRYSESRSIGRLLTLFLFPLLLLLFPFWKLSRPEAVIVSGPPHLSIFNAWIWSRFWGATLIYEVRDIWPLTIVKLGGVKPWHPVILLLSFFERLAYLAADRVVSVLAMASEYFESKGMRSTKFAYIPNGVDISQVKQIESTTSETIKEIAKTKQVVIYTGSFGFANNLEQLLDAAELLKNRTDIHFVFVGDGPFRKNLETKAETLTNVSIFGPVPKSHIPAILDLASICYVGLMKSDLFQHGVSPNKLFDNVAAGKPVIMAIDTKDKIVEKANCGIHVPSCLPIDIAKAIEELNSKSKEELKLIGQNGRTYLEANHTYSALAEKYISVVQEGKRTDHAYTRWAASPFWIGLTIVMLLGSVFHLIIPFFFPDHFKYGIIKVLKDPVLFHELAVATAELSWVQFSFLPHGQLPAGVLAFIYKLTGLHQPFMFLPVLAFLAGLTIRGIASCLDVLGVRGRWWPLIIGVTFTVTPTSLSWMIYPHKDAFIVPGVIILTWTFIAIASRRVLIRHFVSLVFASVLIFSAKSYFAEIFLVGTILSLPFIFKIPTSDLGKYGRAFLILLAIVIFGYVAKNKSAYTNDGDFSRNDLEVSTLKTSPLTQYNKEMWSTERDEPSSVIPRHIDTKENWVDMPGGELINKPLRAMAFTRERFLHERSYANTNFHEEIHIKSSAGAIAYIPRALQLSVLEPLPFSATEGTGMKKILFYLVKFEMIVLYICLIFLIWSGPKNWTPTVLICLLLALPFLLALGMAVPNVGTINRYRFPFLILVKLAGLAALWNADRLRWPGRFLKWIDPPFVERKKKKVLFLVPDDATFIIQRLVMAQGVKSAGFDVHVASEDTGSSAKIEELGFTFHKLDLNRGGVNPFADFKPFIKLIFFLAKERPDILQCVSIKPVLYGATAGTIVGLKKIVCLVNGLGYAFDGNDFKGKIIKRIAIALYRNALALPGIRVIFQNPDDRAYFISNKLVDESKTILIRGSGVNMQKFAPTPLPNNNVPVVLFVGRLLWNKGIKELVEAAKLLKSEYQFRLVIVGAPDERNPEAVPRSYLEQLHAEGIIDWVGRQTDMPKFYREADIICLPTQYKEGLPLTLLEAASTGRPLIATDVPGCREIVRNDENGYLVNPKDVYSLKVSLEKLIVSEELRKRFGERSSEIVKKEFSAEIIQKELNGVYFSLLNNHEHELLNKLTFTPNMSLK